MFISSLTPAFAGNKEAKQDPLRRYAPLPPEGEDLRTEIFPLWGKYPRSGGRGFLERRDGRSVQQTVIAVIAAGRGMKHRAVVPHQQRALFPAMAVMERLAALPAIEFH